MKNIKGFTLVELLGVLVLIATLTLLITFSIVNVVQKTNDTLDESTKKVLYSAAEKYIFDNINVTSNGSYIVTIGDLISKDIISSNFLDSQQSNSLTVDSCIKVKFTNGSPNYELSNNCE